MNFISQTIVRKTLSLILSATILFSGITPTFAQLAPFQKDEKNQYGIEKNYQSTWTLSLESAIKKSLPTSHILERICNSLILCGADKANEDALIISYLSREEFEDTAKTMGLETNPQDYDNALAAEKIRFDKIVSEVKAAYYINPSALSQNTNTILGRILPALLMNKAAKADLNTFAQQAYEKYFKDLNAAFPKPANMEEQAQSLSKNLGNIIYGYATVTQGNSPKELLEVMAKTTATSLATTVVQPFVEFLIATDNYALLEQYIKACAIAEANDAEGGNIFSLADIISQTPSLKDKYAPGRVTQNAMYVKSGSGENAVLGNIWEDLPAVIVQNGGEKGVALINNIFYHGLKITMQNGRGVTPYAYWEKGSLTPFIIGALNTNKIAAKPVENNEALRKQHGANMAGLVEISLMSYKFYDLNNPTYKRVRQILVAPYWGQIYAEEHDTEFTPSRNNLNIFRNTSFVSIFGTEENQFNGTLYNPYYKTADSKISRRGLVLNDNDNTRNANKKMWSNIVSGVSVADTAITVAMLWQMAKLVASLPQMAKSFSTSIKMLRIARKMAGTGNGGWLKAIKILNEPLLKSAIRQSLARGQKTTALGEAQLAAYKKVLKSDNYGEIAIKKPAVKPIAEQAPTLNIPKKSKFQVVAETKDGSTAVLKVETNNKSMRIVEGKLKQPTSMSDLSTKQYNYQIGSNSSGGSSGGSSQTRSLIEPQSPAYAGYHGPSKSYTPAAPKQTVDATRIQKAIKEANWDYFKSILGQLKRTAKTQIGVTALALNLSFSNPAMVIGMQTGRVGPMIENVISAGGGGAKTAKFFMSSARQQISPIPAKIISNVRNLEKANISAAAENFKVSFFPYKNLSISAELAKIRETAFRRSSTIKSPTDFLLQHRQNNAKVAVAVLLSTILMEPFTTSAAINTPTQIAKELTTSSITLQYKIPTQAVFNGYQALRDNAQEKISALSTIGAENNRALVTELKKAFPGKFINDELAALSTKYNMADLLEESSYISKNLFNKIFALAEAETASIEKINNSIKTNSEKSIRSTLSALAQRKALFNNYVEVISNKKAEDMNAFFTEKASVGLSANIADIEKSLSVENDIAETIVQNFFKVKLFRDLTLYKMQGMTKAQRNSIIERINKLEKDAKILEAQGHAKSSIKAIIAGESHNWEKIDQLNPSDIILSVEEDGGNIAQTITDWLHKSNIPLPKNIEGLLQYTPQWIAAQLNLTKDAPGIYVRLDNNTAFIYSADGSKRSRVGTHETETISNLHFHIETRNGDHMLNLSYAFNTAKEDLNLEKVKNGVANADETTLANTSRILNTVAAQFGSKELYNTAGDFNALNSPEDIEAIFRQFSNYAKKTFATDPIRQLSQQGLIGNISTQSVVTPKPGQTLKRGAKPMTKGQFHYYTSKPEYAEEVRLFKKNFQELYSEYTKSSIAVEEDYVSVQNAKALSPSMPYGAPSRLGHSNNLNNADAVTKQNTIAAVKENSARPTRAEVQGYKRQAEGLISNIKKTLYNKKFKTVKEFEDAIMQQKGAFLSQYRNPERISVTNNSEYSLSKDHAPAGIFFVRNNKVLQDIIAPHKKQGYETTILETDLNPALENGVKMKNGLPSKSAVRDEKRLLVVVKFENGNISPIQYLYSDNHYYNFYDIGK